MSQEPSAQPRRMRLLGLHHVTIICADLQRTTDFYRDVLGLALVREGVNDDDPDARHFWFGDARGTAGTLMSFMEYPQMEQAKVGASPPARSPGPAEREARGWVGAVTDAPLARSMCASARR